MINKLLYKTKRLFSLPDSFSTFVRTQPDLDRKHPKVLAGRMLANFNNQHIKNLDNLSEVEFQVFSQWGDDGIIQWLIHRLNIKNKSFIEFGVENYLESNTRFLLVNNNWQGLVIDGSSEHIKYIKNDLISNAHHLHAKNAFITKDNINQLLSDLPFGQQVGILSIDIDGNDYFVWEAINVVEADIVILEYNAHFRLNPWSIPYQADYVRSNSGFRMNYWGASLQAFYTLAQEKGYSLIGCNSAGNNCYFVKNEKLSGLSARTPEEVYEFAKFRETKDEQGEWISDDRRSEQLTGLPIYNVISKKQETIKF